MRSTTARVRAMRPRAPSPSATVAPRTATRNTSSSVREAPSRTTAAVAGRVSEAAMRLRWGAGRRRGVRSEHGPAAAVAAVVVVKLEVRLRVQRDEEGERERPGGRLREGEDGPPVVQLALKRDDVAAELLR